MENSNEKLIESLKHLLSISNDGKEGYRNAAENVDSPDLKAVLTAYSLQRTEFASALKTAIMQAGGDPDNEDGGPLGLLHRAWIDIKTAFTVNDNKAVLDACITGEKAAVEAYDEALADETLAAPLRQMLSAQRSGIDQSLTNIDSLSHQFA